MAREIVIHPYDTRWPAEFAAVATPLRDGLGSLALRIDHIGSTAVPGLAAKDVIDVQITVAALDREALEPALARIGYTLHESIAGDHVPPGQDPDPAAWRKLFARPPAGQRPTNVHVREAGRANQRYALLFRDFLRAMPETAEAYGRVKAALARLHPRDADAYYDVKDPVCDVIIAAAERWAAATGYEPGPADC